MLVKKKLLEMPLPSRPGKTGCCVNAYVEDGIYHLALWNNGALLERVYSDGKNVAAYDEREERWNGNINNYDPYSFSSCETRETQDCLKLTRSFFDCAWSHNSLGVISSHVSTKRSVQRRVSKQRAYDRMVQNINSIPADPPELEAYCDTYVFKHYYAIIARGEKARKSESCSCTGCNKKFKHKGRLRQRENLTCPKCGRELEVIHQRYLSSATDKANILVFSKYGDDTIGARWEKITRTYLTNGKPTYKKEPYRWELHYKDGEIKRYKWQASNYGTADYMVDRWDGRGHLAYVYALNLRESFPNIHGANPDKLIEAGEVDFQILTESLEKETGRTLYRLGLYKLAEKSEYLQNGKTFAEVLGVGKDYLPIMRKLNIDLNTLMIMRLSKKRLTDEQIRKITSISRKMGYDVEKKIEQVLKYMSLERFVNYFYKQHLIRPKTDLSTLVGWYLDYRNMSSQLNEQLREGKGINTTASAFVMPRDLKEAHDGAISRLKTVKNKEKDRIIRRLGERLQKKKPFETNGLIIVYPTSIEDFVREGAELKHCIGSGMQYIDAQASGKMLSVFIRRANRPDKPYYTATFYPRDGYRLRECHGMGHKAPLENVKKLLKAYQAYMKGNAARIDSAA